MSPIVATVCGFTRLDHSNQDGFVLPLLRMEGHTTWLVQQADESTDRIISFKILEGEPANTQAISDPDSVSVSIGQPQAYAFVEGLIVHVGTKVTLAPVLSDFIRRNPHSLATSLQICEMIGTMNDRRIARTKMRDLIRSDTGTRAAASFYKSSLESAFWMKLVSSWNLVRYPNRREEIRSQFRISVEVDGTFKVENVLPQDEYERDKLSDIVRDLEAEFEPSALQTDAIDYSESWKKEQLKTIRRTVRQEERIALLLLEILKDRRGGKILLKNYAPRASFERAAIILITMRFDSATDSLATDETVIANLVSGLFSYCFPMNRGYLLEYLAKHLAQYPEIKAAIKMRLDRTSSHLVHLRDSSILSNLNRSNQTL